MRTGNQGDAHLVDPTGMGAELLAAEAKAMQDPVCNRSKSRGIELYASRESNGQPA
jgi:hypothetical protein